MDVYHIMVILYFLALFGSMLVFPQVRAVTLIVTGISVLILALKAKKSIETETPDEEDKSWMGGFIFGIVVAFVGICGALNLIF
ncbi:MAG TPA: hypothetical protein DCO72_06845 [Ruminococcus sp.]|nr:hypothetical protein [Ruminococcus sp.]